MWERERGGGNENADVGTRTWRWERGRGGGALWSAGKHAVSEIHVQKAEEKTACAQSRIYVLPPFRSLLARSLLSLFLVTRGSLRVGIDKRIQLVFFRISSANSARIHSAKFPRHFLFYSSCFRLFPRVFRVFPRAFSTGRGGSLHRRPFRSAKTSLNSLQYEFSVELCGIAWRSRASKEKGTGRTFFTSAAACGTTAAEATDAAAASAQATAVPAISWSRVCVRTPRSASRLGCLVVCKYFLSLPWRCVAGPVSPLRAASLKGTLSKLSPLLSRTLYAASSGPIKSLSFCSASLRLPTSNSDSEHGLERRLDLQTHLLLRDPNTRFPACEVATSSSTLGSMEPDYCATRQHLRLSWTPIDDVDAIVFGDSNDQRSTTPTQASTWLYGQGSLSRVGAAFARELVTWISGVGTIGNPSAELAPPVIHRRSWQGCEGFTATFVQSVVSSRGACVPFFSFVSLLPS